jgi:hypothetical protein
MIVAKKFIFLQKVSHPNLWLCSFAGQIISTILKDKKSLTVTRIGNKKARQMPGFTIIYS